MATKFPDLTGDGEVTQADILKGRGVFQEGGTLMMPEEGMPVDTYPNIPADEMAEADLLNFQMKRWKIIT